MSFFNSLYNSLYNFKWLKEQRDNTSWAWGYFFLLVFLITGLSVIPNAINFFRESPNWKNTISKELPDFKAKVTQGKLQVEQLPQPFVKQYGEVVVAVDTVSTGTLSVKQFLVNDQLVGILATADRLEFYNPQDKSVKIEPFSSTGDFVTDRAQVLNNVDKILNKRMLSLFAAVYFVTLFAFIAIGNLLNILLFSVIFYQLGKRRQINFSFKQVFNIGLFASTLPIILSQALPIYPILNFIWMILFGVWMYYTLFKVEK